MYSINLGDEHFQAILLIETTEFDENYQKIK